jgi:hypothetical protein
MSPGTSEHGGPGHGAGTQTSSPGPAGTAEIDSALRKFRDVLSADGYGLDWSLGERNGIVIRIVAGADACADCLVPLPVMEAIMSDALSETPYTLDRIELPATS